MKTQNTFNQPTVLKNGPVDIASAALVVKTTTSAETDTTERFSNIPFIAMIEQRRDAVLKANNLDESSENSSHYLWVKGIYDDLIEFLSISSPTIPKN